MVKKILSSLFVVLLTFIVVAAEGQSKGTLKGKAVDEKGKPVAGADVRAINTGDQSIAETKTDSSGRYSFELVSGTYKLVFDAEGYTGGPHRELKQVEEGKETDVGATKLLKEKKKASLVRGAVFDSLGRSLAGARVKLVRIPVEDEEQDKKFTSLSRDYVTNSRGEFAFRLPSIRARYRVTATLDGYKPETKEIDVSESEAVPLAFSLEPVKK